MPAASRFEELANLLDFRRVSRFTSFSNFVSMSTFDNAKDTTAQKAEEAKSMGQEKAGQAQGTAEV